MSQTYTLAWCGSEKEVTRGDAAVGQDGGVDPGKKVGDAGVHIRSILRKIGHKKYYAFCSQPLYEESQRVRGW